MLPWESICRGSGVSQLRDWMGVEYVGEFRKLWHLAHVESYRCYPAHSFRVVLHPIAPLETRSASTTTIDEGSHRCASFGCEQEHP